MNESVKSRKEQVLDLIREHGGPMKRKQILDQIDVSGTRLDNILEGLRSEGAVVKPRRGHYDLPSRVEQSLFDEDNRNDDIGGGPIKYPLGRAGAGDGRTCHKDTLQVDARLIRSSLGRVPSPQEAFWTQVQGDSMSPWIESGEYVFATVTDHVDVPGRYVVWWGQDQAEICVHLAKISENTLRVTKYGPEESWDIRHKDGDIYELPNGDSVRVRVRGKVEWPRATAQSVLETVTDQMGKMLEKALNQS